MFHGVAVYVNEIPDGAPHSGPLRVLGGVSSEGSSEVSRPSSSADDTASSNLRAGNNCFRSDCPTIVYTHGFTLAARSFYHQLGALAGEANQVAWDMRGHGKSEGGEYSISEAADDLIAIIDQFAPGPLVLVGHSMGGMVNFNAYRRMSPAMRDRVKAIVAISTSMREFSDEGVAQILNSKALGRAAEVDKSVFARVRRATSRVMVPFLRLFVFKRESSDVEFHAEMIEATRDEAVRGFYDDLRDHEERMEISVPGWVVVGERDEVTPEKGIAQDWPDAEIVRVPRAGHMVILEAPDVMSEVIRKAVKVAAAAE